WLLAAYRKGSRAPVGPRCQAVLSRSCPWRRWVPKSARVSHHEQCGCPRPCRRDGRPIHRAPGPHLPKGLSVSALRRRVLNPSRGLKRWSFYFCHDTIEPSDEIAGHLIAIDFVEGLVTRLWVHLMRDVLEARGAVCRQQLRHIARNRIAAAIENIDG